MLAALAEDFAALPGVEVVITWDVRLGEPPPQVTALVVRSARHERAAFVRAAQDCDATLVIAPEIAGALLERVQMAADAGARLLGPDPGFVTLASDKHQTAKRLHAAGVPVPPGMLLAGDDAFPVDFSYPAVLKPCDGAGSQGVFLLKDASARSPREVATADADMDLASHDALPTKWRLESFCPGVPASVAVVCRSGGHIVLPACRQHLSEDGRFRYLGGSLPLPQELNHRAASLAQSALQVLPPARGYIGFDVVLGSAQDGSQDRVIEVNPRITTSYVGLRRACTSNLAAALLKSAKGESPPLIFNSNGIYYTPNGTISETPHF